MGSSMESNPSAARTFFSTYKQLFEYDKHLGSQDPFQLETRGDGKHSATSSFLQRYRDCDTREPTTVTPTPSHVASSFTLLHPPQPARSMGPLLGNPTTTTYPRLAPQLFSLRSTAPRTFSSPQHAEFDPPSPQRAFQQAALHDSFSQPQVLSMDQNSTPILQYLSPQRVPFSTSNHGAFSSPTRVDPPQEQYTPMKHQVGLSLKRAPFCMPKLSDLLIDHATRATTVSHKAWDDAHKIQVLIGGKCVGRMSATSRNLPESVRKRLQASANVAVRRDRLFNLLRRDYEELQQRGRR